jgi:hypothetical protein
MSERQNIPVPISAAALMKRINRKLAKRGEILKKCQTGSRWYAELGPYYVVATDNGVIARKLELATCARSLKVIEAWEELSE